MGLFSMIARAFGFGREDARVLVIGLDNSGKTTLIHHIKASNKGAPEGEALEVTPTVGFQQEEFKVKNINFTVYDMSGQGRYRTLWEHYYTDCQAIIFVLDSTDRLRLCVAKEELQLLLGHAAIKTKRCPVLFFANKMDMPGALTPEECMVELELDKIRDKPWHISSSNAVSGLGVPQGIEWLCENIAAAAAAASAESSGTKK
jgi:ADP-ribosylation factor-like protein 6